MPVNLKLNYVMKLSDSVYLDELMVSQLASDFPTRPHSRLLLCCSGVCPVDLSILGPFPPSVCNTAAPPAATAGSLLAVYPAAAAALSSCSSTAATWTQTLAMQ
jgi:hypothetical protein